ncbi:Alpha-catulin [Trachymyrmex septentrionalis]|uniref:Alpha-catulin n=1 Tax=Trachymyrmex septentrionalis TaxID=34720 RepID=A0A151K0G0_9HYME|nr:PREDICTED: alpha-catulin isoform X4 [Atta colombica]XP_018302062.1 PREDICTED: alpha-catulin isoform X2 [Trachymyrmex zeteki]XP_018354229.1 PREDICTED: alpha-catulin isoform X2 [Trachymyrmex septentrionalis]KYN44181.1 Alpha-catulin [Trachymyrmex septentrionalis]
MATPDPVDPATLEIKTRSIEQTLLPLVKQISTLISHRERPLCSDRSLRAVARVGQAVNLAVERFVTVGETIADDNPEIKQDMYEACKEARVAGSAIEKLCECALEDSLADRGSVVRAARCLLGSVTKVLLLADIVVVNQLLHAKDKVARSLGRLESVSNFTEFVKAFSQFGGEMVELAHLTGDRQNDLKDERRRAQMAAARQVLERSTMMLLTSSKTCLRHPECPSAKENRDTVFCQMRRAMDLIHYVVKDGVLDCSESQSYSNSQSPQQEDWDSSTVCSALKHFERLVETTRMTLLGPGCRETLTSALETVVERTQDFTDSAYTSHEHRENILLLCDRAKLELNTLLRIGNSMNYEGGGGSPSSEMEQAVMGVLRATRDLRQQLSATTMEQAGDLGQVTKAGQELVSTIRNLALANDIDRLQESSDRFHEYIEHILEVCKLLRHVALSESLQVSAKFTEINLRIYGPQVVTAAHTLARHPTSKIAKENLEVFADMWQWLMTDVTTVAKDVLELSQNRPEKQVYMSLPRPGKHGTTSKPLKPVRLDSEEQAKIAKAGLEMKLITSEMDAETEKWQESGSALEENNDIVKRAKNMSSMAFSMYQFTRGEGALKTTQDLFTQAEYFAEEANRLYKVVRQFSYQVPGGPHKKDLLENLDRVPTYVQQLQFTVKNPTVGKAATFTKVDNVIQETKNLMNVISKVVTTCFVCATKYNLDFRGLSARGAGGSPYRGGEGGGADGDGGGVGVDGSKTGSAPGSDPSV